MMPEEQKPYERVPMTKKQMKQKEKPESVPSCGDGWISVKEQSPEVNQWVLGFIVEYDFEDRKVIGEDISVVSRNYEGDWFENAGDVLDYAEVTHWMPLPKAPTKP